MPLSADIMRLLLIGCMASLTILAAIYLRRRALSPISYTAWGLFALILPIIGPFLVIWLRPGGSRTA
ncbi:MAG: hypothetical protein FJ010_03160 [Chloroflexi bacterium]|nr:hypothetical protein [Chloroflexota bacterium]